MRRTSYDDPADPSIARRACRRGQHQGASTDLIALDRRGQWLMYLVGLSLVAVAVAGCGGGGSNAAAEGSQRTSSRIAFASTHDDGVEIYVIDADGSNLERLTDNDATDTNPAWSPDKSKIAFESNRGSSADVYVMNADGSHQQRLTRNDAYDGRPSWSPDGTRIAFTSDGNIYVMNADGGAQRRLTRGPRTGRGDDHPAWSPDGTKIAFDRSDVGGFAEIYVIHTDGSGLQGLTRTSELSIAPAWSPDGTKLAFASVFSGIYVMRADGTAAKRLTQDAGAPAWSPDGRKIAFTSSRQEQFEYEIYVMSSNGSGERRLTQGVDVESDVISWR